MSEIIDRRGQSSGQTTASRRRFRERYKGYIKKAVDRAISDGNVTDIGAGGTDVSIPKRDLKQPHISHGQGGINDIVHPGNKEFIGGERFRRPNGGGSGGNGEGAGQNGGGEDDFTFHLSEEEFLKYLFDDLELPNLEEKREADLTKYKRQRAGIVSSGPHSKLDLARSKSEKLGRVMGMSANANRKMLALLQEKREILRAYAPNYVPPADPAKVKVVKPTEMPMAQRIRGIKGQIVKLSAEFGAAVEPNDSKRMAEIDSEIKKLAPGLKNAAAWNESTDLKYRFDTKKPLPNSKAVMICIMDVSGSMTQEHKDQAKIFYFLLYRFLKRHYLKTDIVFVRHHTEAKEVDEKEFFYGRETGGTTVSSALQLTRQIIDQRYGDGNWNIYGAQASDGDNWADDTRACKPMIEDLLKDMQAYFYTEITPRDHQNLWHMYAEIQAKHPDQFWMGQIRNRQEIFPIFREFFQRRSAGTNVSANLRPASLDMV